MAIKCGLPVFVFGGLFTAYVHCVYAQARSELRTLVEDAGSVPPVNQWFRCIHELERKPYNHEKAQECLNSILSHPEIEKGAIAFDDRRDLLTFSLSSPTLVVSDMHLDVLAGELAKFHELLSQDALRQGEPYTRDAESRVWSALNLLFRSQGRRAGISRTLHFDYERKTAQVVYKIWEGPSGEPETLPPPYSAPCSITSLNFNYMDTDDFTPLELIRRQLKIKPMGCFSETKLREDRDSLEKMAFLKERNISVSDAAGNGKSFSFHLRSNPIPIGKVTVHAYGLLSGLSENEVPSLTVREGSTYSRSRAAEQEGSLEKFFKREGWQVKSFADVQVDSTGKATLDFSILAYPDDVVYINDKPYDVTLKRQE
jgi:hypothetical protein